MVQIHICEPPGDILVFLTGEEEIEDACKKIGKEVSQAGDQVRRRRLGSGLGRKCLDTEIARDGAPRLA